MFFLLFVFCAASAASSDTEGSVGVCEENISSFTQWNETAHASSVNGTCVENAEPELLPLPRAYCERDGSWNIAHGCVCKAGFQISDGGCQKCPPTHFSGRNATSCIPSCLPRSIANSDRTKCECENGFYRLDDDNGAPCYGVPSDVQNLRAVKIGPTDVELEWTRPVDDGGLSELKYLVHCDSGPCGLFNKVREERAFISGLSPDTNYVFRVDAINQVSAQHSFHPGDGMIVSVRTGVARGANNQNEAALANHLLTSGIVVMMFLLTN
ncbi:hypothetical protein PENTCL1PPCAC_24411 [Pristionchus entomophagus]|uniref:Fibronectin type-III domain-containing protein n=1 Tax=Pristionchus entomophagus TaxID=358040 RepID=A0AAV5U6S6_9BILA|nr:hypothetical protein PENTCL1PPCAC_24411 [Pristionchus entomophagus]